MAQQRCGSCRFWVSAPAKEMPTCHRDAVVRAVRSLSGWILSEPTGAVLMRGGRTKDVTASEDDWCGQWEPRPTEP